MDRKILNVLTGPTGETMTITSRAGGILNNIKRLYYCVNQQGADVIYSVIKEETEVYRGVSLEAALLAFHT